MTGVVNELYGAIEEIRRRRRIGGASGVDQGWLADEKALQEVAEVSLPWYESGNVGPLLIPDPWSTADDAGKVQDVVGRRDVRSGTDTKRSQGAWPMIRAVMMVARTWFSNNVVIGA